MGIAAGRTGACGLRNKWRRSRVAMKPERRSALVFLLQKSYLLSAEPTKPPTAPQAGLPPIHTPKLQPPQYRTDRRVKPSTHHTLPHIHAGCRPPVRLRAPGEGGHKAQAVLSAAFLVLTGEARLRVATNEHAHFTLAHTSHTLSQEAGPFPPACPQGGGG